MRALILLAALALGAAPAAAQPAPADPLLLHPASVGLGLERAGDALVVERVLPGSPAAAAGVSAGDTLVAVDGRAAASWSTWQAQTALAGAPGSAVVLELRARAGARTVRLSRADVLAPPAMAGVVATRRFVVHHRAGDERRARAVARAAERAYERSTLPRETGGRRAHLYLVDEYPRDTPPLPLWADWTSAETNVYGPSFRPYGYLAYGDPGRAAEERLAPLLVWPVNAREAHRRAAGRRASPGVSPTGEPASREEVAAVSLREHVRQRYGADRLEALWRSPLPWDQAVPRELGLPAAKVERWWRLAIARPGPNREVELEARTVRAALGWGALLLLLGVAAARRREAA